MSPVLDLLRDALAFHRLGLRPAEIASRLVALAHERGLSAVYEVAAGRRVEIRFPTGDKIVFDGFSWRCLSA